jgi:restriction endonuclease S subunit
MKHNWTTYRLGDFLERQYESVAIDDLSKYKRITIKTKGEGIVLRDEVEGLEIGTKNQFKVKENQFLLSKIDAMNGAFGIVPSECDNGIITGNFWTYNINEEIAEREYLRLLCMKQVFTNFSIEASEGTTNRKYLREDKFLNLSIPLPPLAEQQHIVAKIESIKNKIDEIKRLREEQEKEIGNLLYSYFKDLIDNYETKPLSEGIEHRSNFIQIDDETNYKLCRVQTKAQGVVLRENKIGFEIKTKSQQVCNAGDFLVAEMDARFGGYGIVPDELDGAIVSSHYFLYSFNKTKLNRKFLEYFSQTIWFHSQVEAKGSTNYAAIRPKQVLNYQIPLPPIEEQNRIVSFLEKVNQIKQNYQQQEAELNELMPSLLDKAFKGELFANSSVSQKATKVINLPQQQVQEEKHFLKRKVLATYIINQSLNDAKFGDVKFEKLLHLSDYFAIKRNLGQNYYQQPAGPYDNTFTHAYFQQVLNAKWFNRNKKGNKFVFSAGLNNNKSNNTYGFFSEEELNRVNKIINYFKNSDYEQPEIISTLYAVWNNRIIRQQEITDELLTEDFLNWDKQKIKYKDRIKPALQWMRNENFVPDGWGKLIEKSKAKTKKSKK